MKIPKSAAHILVGIEVLLLVVVVFISIVNPAPKVDTDAHSGQVGSENTLEQQNTEENTEEQSLPQSEPLVFSQEVQDKVAAMTLEQKVAQLFITTPETLTNMRQVTATGNTTRNAINAIPVGGLVYSSLNFEGTVQTASMTEALQEYCKTQLGTPIFMMISEAGGENGSPLAVNNGFAVQMSASEVGATGDVQQAANKAVTIADYMKNQGLNTNMGLWADLSAGVNPDYDVNTFSSDANVAASMMSASIQAYKEAGIVTAVTMLPGESTGNSMDKALADWQGADALVYEAAVSAGVDIIVISNGYAPALTGEPQVHCCMSADVVNYIRSQMKYQGILMTDALTEAPIRDTHSVSDAAIGAINAGMDMIYCPTDLQTAYQAVLDAVNAGTISVETIDTAVMRILTCKNEKL